MQSTPAKRSKSPQTDCHPPKIPRCNLKPKRHHREHRCWSPKNDTLSPDFLAKPNRYSAFLLAVLHRFHFSDSRSQTAQIVLRALSEHADLHAKHRNPEAADRCRTADNRCNLSSKRWVLPTDRGPTYVAGPVEYPMPVGLDSYLLANPRSVASLLTMSDPIRPRVRSLRRLDSFIFGFFRRIIRFGVLIRRTTRHYSHARNPYPCHRSGWPSCISKVVIYI